MRGFARVLSPIVAQKSFVVRRASDFVGTLRPRTQQCTLAVICTLSFRSFKTHMIVSRIVFDIIGTIGLTTLGLRNSLVLVSLVLFLVVLFLLVLVVFVWFIACHRFLFCFSRPFISPRSNARDLPLGFFALRETSSVGLAVLF